MVVAGLAGVLKVYDYIGSFRRVPKMITTTFKFAFDHTCVFFVARPLSKTDISPTQRDQ